MKHKTISTITTASLLLTCLTFFTGCFSGDTAMVTIHIEGRNTATTEHPVKAKSLIDRFLMLFSSPAYAWSYTPDTLLIQITGMEDVYFESFPLDTNTFSYEVSAGVPVTITVITENYDSGKNWIARTTVNLTPGQEADVVMKMIPVTALTEVYNNGEYMSVGFENVSPYALGYRLYRSNSREGTYTFVANHILGNCEEECWIYDYSTSPSDTYFYKVTVIGEYGEGLPTDPQSNPYPAK